ncbi:GntP family permease [Streptomonospora nanhaiensis]|uniref:GntP family gluconate:H+ symporter n=1 Tax=Streptomonospora nanhaiensis TaxID=1323731 RepID=A0A853BXN7_9ACTN|nr:GntP family permease [Streptomonospora nanhaiensis]MBV2364689.1 GntP family permease [Streptomonospora nanhaiensis]MBX9389552.1 GntP family permease [Streptomonospora nanhaiensis]NYI99251.1 GntP family gluconate:H+ symporter [Streptomonospora nanhaiensis]
MEAIEPAYGTVPLLLIAAAAIAVLLILVIWVRLHAFVALTLVSLLTALATRIPLADVVPTLLEGFGSTLASVALLVGLGVMIGRLLEISGGAAVLANSLIRAFGERRAGFALGVASLIFGFPIFFDAGLIVMLPIIFSVARRLGGSVLFYALPAAGAFAVMHAFVPPHPGPVAGADLIGANMGTTLIVGTVLAIPTWYIASYLFSRYAGRRFDLPVPDDLVPSGEQDGQRPPHLLTVLGVLLMPMLLIFANTGASTLVTTGTLSGDAAWVQALVLIGQTPVALLITTLVAMVVLPFGRFGRGRVEDIANEALGPVCAIILITGAGGMFGGVLRTSGIGEALASSLEATGLPVIVAAFVIATALRVAQGSATVALTTTAALVAPLVEATDGLSSLDLSLIVIAIACGSTVLSHVNDSGFWLVGRFLGMDTKTTLRTWTVMETLIGVVGFAFAAGLSLVL